MVCPASAPTRLAAPCMPGASVGRRAAPGVRPEPSCASAKRLTNVGFLAGQLLVTEFYTYLEPTFFLTDTCRRCDRIGNCHISVTKEKFLGRKAMSQNGRREFLTSAAAVAAALAACTAPAPGTGATCVTMYDEHDIVPKVAPYVHDTAFRNQLITFPATITPTMANLTQPLVDNTLAALARPGIGITTVTVARGTEVPLGTYKLIRLGTTPAPPFQRSPVVLSLAQYMANTFNPDWTKILMFVIPDPLGPGGSPISPGDATSAMCAHPFGM
jgi:hypothetical protein